MHNNGFRAAGLDCVYVACDVPPSDLATAVSGLVPLGVKGVNVTIPHKVEIMQYLDEVTRDAELTGAVNTIKNEGGRLVGYNTDVPGFLRALKTDLDFDPNHKNVLLIGAGGAARAVVTAVCSKGASSVQIANRTLQKAQELAGEFGGHFPDVKLSSVALDATDELKNALSMADIIVNSSSMGMEGEGELDIDLEELNPNAVIYDLVYKPRETDLVKSARELGHRAAGGLSMLLYQGAESFTIWTGVDAPIDAMRDALE